MKIALFGAGSVGCALLRQVATGAAPDLRIVCVATGHHGRVVSPSALDARELLGRLESGESLGDASTDVKQLLQASGAEALVECIPQNVRAGEPSISYLRAALDLGLHAVTSSKPAIARGIRDLRQRAQKAGKQIRFETTVLDGTPLFSLVAGRLPSARVERVRGVLSATTSVILDAVESGSTRARGLARAQAMEVAESDPVLDVDGWDAAAKAAVLANVWMAGALRPEDVHRVGLEGMSDDDIRAAARKGKRVRLVAEVERTPEGFARARVKPAILEPDDPLYSLRGQACGVTLTTDRGGTMTILQGNPTIEHVGYGLLCDLVALQEGWPQP